MARNVAQQLIESHLVSGEMQPGEEIALSVDQTLTQDATGTMVMLELEALGPGPGPDRASRVQYVDHNLLQADSKNADDHAVPPLGLPPVRPVVLQARQRRLAPRAHAALRGARAHVLVGSDSHTCAAGSLGMLAIGVGGLDVAMAMAGEPLLPADARDLGRRADRGAAGMGVGQGRRPGDAAAPRRQGRRATGSSSTTAPAWPRLTAMDRHVIANMGAELGATTTVFPADDAVRAFLRAEQREHDYTELRAEPDAATTSPTSIDLSALEPLIACPSSPGNVVPGPRGGRRATCCQVVIGSSANPGLRDFAIVAAIVRGPAERTTRCRFDVNPTSRQILQDLARMGGDRST